MNIGEYPFLELHVPSSRRLQTICCYTSGNVRKLSQNRKDAEYKEQSDHSTAAHKDQTEYMIDLYKNQRTAHTAPKPESPNMNGPQKYWRNISPKLKETRGIRTTEYSEIKQK
jgi:hypothetical protein